MLTPERAHRTVPELCLFAYWARHCRDTPQRLWYVPRDNKQSSGTLIHTLLHPIAQPALTLTLGRGTPAEGGKDRRFKQLWGGGQRCSSTMRSLTLFAHTPQEFVHVREIPLQDIQQHRADLRGQPFEIKALQDRTQMLVATR